MPNNIVSQHEDAKPRRRKELFRFASSRLRGFVLELWRCLGPAVLAALLTLVVAPTAEAHANLVRSEPAGGALLDSPPDQVVLEFSEELDPAFSRVQLLDGKNQLVDPGPGTIDSSAPRVL